MVLVSWREFYRHSAGAAPAEAHHRLCRCGTLEQLLSEPGAAEEHQHSAVLRDMLRELSEESPEPLPPPRGSEQEDGQREIRAPEDA
jgi:hypothetical protein